MHTHQGKIGRLPKELREQINRRLEDGETAGPLLEWLNGLPAVQAVLATDFENRPINEQNLSNWRTGGYQYWQHQQEGLNLAQVIAEDVQELEAQSGGGGGAAFTLGKNLSTILMAELAGTIYRVLPRTENAVDRWRHAQSLIRNLSRLRREVHQDAQRELEQKRRAAQAAEEAAFMQEFDAPAATVPTASPSLPSRPAESAPPAPAPVAPDPAAIDRNLREVSKVLDLYPDLPAPYALNPVPPRLIKPNQAKSR